MRTLKEVLGNDWIGYFTRKETIEDLMSRINLGHQKFVGIESIKRVNETRISVIFNTLKDGIDNNAYNLLDVIMEEPTWEQMMDATFGVGHKCEMRIVVYDKKAKMLDKVSNRYTAVKFANIDNDCGVITYILAADVNGNNQSGEIDLQYHIDASPDGGNITELKTLPNREEFEQAEFLLYSHEYPINLQEDIYTLNWWFCVSFGCLINDEIDVVPIWNEKGFHVQLKAHNLMGHQTLVKLLRCKRSVIDAHFSVKNIEIYHFLDNQIKITVRYDNRPFSDFECLGIAEKINCARRYREVVFKFRDFFEDLIIASGELKKWIFSSKDNYEEVLKYHEGPPCNNCLVFPFCFKSTVDDYDDNYVIVSNQPCDEAKKWFMLAEVLDDFISSFMMLPEGLLTIEDIKNMIELGDIIDLENQMGLKLPNKSIASDFQYFAGFLFELLSITYKDEIMREFIIPFIAEQSNLLKQREK